MRRSVQAAIRTETAFLQAQIKPHFLFNALNAIIATCPTDPNQATELLVKLSDYLRSSFGFHNLDQLVPLRQELMLVEAYLSLEKARFDDRLRVEYDIEADWGRLLPPLSIQPIVENAVRHGIMQREEGGSIRVSVRTEDQRLIVRITDDGVGIESDMLPELLQPRNKDRGGVGLINIHRRLLTLYGEGLHIESEWQQGTVVSFTVPQRGVRNEGDSDR
jgi:sensor histidine kinase YesM